jgi:hypothetical protein
MLKEDQEKAGADKDRLAAVRGELAVAKAQVDDLDSQLEEWELKIMLYQQNFDEEKAQLIDKYETEIKRLESIISDSKTDSKPAAQNVRYLRPNKIVVAIEDESERRDLERLATMDTKDGDEENSKSRLEFRIVQRELDKFRDLYKSQSDRNVQRKKQVKTLEDEVKALQKNLRLKDLEIEIEKLSALRSAEEFRRSKPIDTVLTTDALQVAKDRDSGIPDDLEISLDESPINKKTKKSKKRNKKGKRSSMDKENAVLVLNKNELIDVNVQPDGQVRRGLQATDKTNVVDVQ